MIDILIPLRNTPIFSGFSNALILASALCVSATRSQMNKVNESSRAISAN
jgi:hypothetical protein